MWTAHAERADSGDRFGIECSAGSEEAAIDGLVRWLTWQHQHASALDELVQVERAYHRTMAGRAFDNAIEGPPAVAVREALEQVDAARVSLDEIRVRKPL